MTAMHTRFWTALSILTLAAACKSSPPEPEPAPAETAEPRAPAPPPPPAPASTPAAAEKSAAKVAISPDDPLKGQFTLEDALEGLPGKGQPFAQIDTELGKLECELYADKAPITVANFVGLARGIRPWRSPQGEWVKKPGYDGTTFHRVIKGFMVQGGDPEGSGRGEPGYVIPDEIWEGGSHDQRGLICMANRGPNTNGMQFFILDAPTKRLDGGYTIFGKCGPDSVIEKLAGVEVRGDKSVNPTKIKKVTISRKPSKARPSAAPATSG
jgi:peptidyl-prolyl cis-trans isomerase A (cyclophilin A)